ncbi:glycoside hydrolase family 3 N-terminal domain-containing protein [Cryobacterium tepidiphilum]|uniref:beta-N-acetylhexosaminidase n=1 Tax=Cryobacterium tepidiphilum TaxID=2486026 RepID=A0A3M8KUQ7_9MICO|nr:glycoside hydrolase family 3 N-terminal domain-containing protein [Cryobacterium tepidiphilum]RNE56993.1 glycoside hydrolase family 3 protein [Cryobacterium tepidiphilum]
MRPRIFVAVACLAVATLCASCESNSGAGGAASSVGRSPSARATTPATPTPTSLPTVTPTPTPSLAEATLARMSDAERVGQLFMIGCPSTTATDACRRTIRAGHIGAVILTGNSTLSIAGEKNVTAALLAAAPAGVRLFIATDQEGGLVQRMQGSGFTDISSAVDQGQWATADLQRAATTWGRELWAAGINVDLAPVLDTVPPGVDNAPIGELDRGYGHTPEVVSRQGNAVAQGLAAAGLIAAAKHFPGLGRVTENTDTSAHVVDDTTTADDPALLPFVTAIRSGVAFVMMSTAVYTRIDDSTPAAFSRPIVTGLLRHDLGFGGVVISDDLGAAEQVAGYAVAERALKFIAAGGDLVLTVDASQAEEMTSAVLNRMRSDTAFREQVDAAALRVLAAKQAHSLLSP